MAPALAKVPVGIVVERRKAQSPWIDFTWRPVTALVGLPDAAPWTVLSQDQEGATFYAGAAEIELYRTETANYRDNLGSGTPKLWVALRPTGVEPPYEIFAVTADPAEGEAWTESGNDLIDVVPMPEEVRVVIDGFVAAHHVERPVLKRERDRADPEALARRGPGQKERE
ncbi:MAG: DUF3305 domain-containing protein [Xanthobacteraceae bacterium]